MYTHNYIIALPCRTTGGSGLRSSGLGLGDRKITTKTPSNNSNNTPPPIRPPVSCQSVLSVVSLGAEPAYVYIIIIYFL